MAGELAPNSRCAGMILPHDFAIGLADIWLTGPPPGKPALPAPLKVLTIALL
jgi:hypothetical protein